MPADCRSGITSSRSLCPNTTAADRDSSPESVGRLPSWCPVRFRLVGQLLSSPVDRHNAASRNGLVPIRCRIPLWRRERPAPKEVYETNRDVEGCISCPDDVGSDYFLWPSCGSGRRLKCIESDLTKEAAYDAYEWAMTVVQLGNVQSYSYWAVRNGFSGGLNAFYIWAATLLRVRNHRCRQTAARVSRCHWRARVETC